MSPTRKHADDGGSTTFLTLCKAGTNVVFLDADVAKVFKDSASVNSALRLLVDEAKGQVSAKRSA